MSSTNLQGSTERPLYGERLIEDATSAGLNIKSISEISKVDVFQKNN